MLIAEQEVGSAAETTNHPLAFRMAVIAFITNNITIGTIFGSFSVLLAAVEERLGIGRSLSTLSIPALNLAMAICAPIAGVIATRYSLRVLMITGAVLGTAGFVLLAVTNSYPLYLIAYGVLLGPSMALGVILSASLVTRWFVVNRGRTLGIIFMPMVIAAVPLTVNWTLQSSGLIASYWILAALSAVSIVATCFVVDAPPKNDAAIKPAANTIVAAPGGSMNVATLLKSPRFWALSVAGVSSTTSSIILTAHMVPMAATWGYTTTMAATLLTVQSLIGIAGTMLFGWIADRIGGINSLALLVLDSAILWAALLLHPPFPVTVVLVGLIGLHGAGVLPVISLVLSEAFGRDNFSRAYGINNLLALPFSVLCVPVAAIVYTRTGSYTGAIIGQVSFFLIAMLLALSARRRKSVQSVAVAA